MDKGISIFNKPEISAIYYALLQSSYDFYLLEKDYDLIDKIGKFRNEERDFDQCHQLKMT